MVELVKHDVVLRRATSQESLGLSIAEYLQLQGYCCVETGFLRKVFTDVLDEVGELEEIHSVFKPVPAQIFECLIDSEEPVSYAELRIHPAKVSETASKKSSEDEDGPEPGPTLQLFDGSLSYMVAALRPWFGSLGLSCTERSCAMLQVVGSELPGTGEAAELQDENALTSTDAVRWLNCLLRRRLTLLMYLGPEPTCTIELRLDEEDAEDKAEAIEVTLGRGSLLVARSDIMKLRFSTALTEEANAVFLSCFVLDSDRSGVGRGARHNEREGWVVLPSFRPLMAWISNELSLASRLDASEEIDPDKEPVSRGWKFAQTHQFGKGAPVVVNGISAWVPSSEDLELTLAQFSVGADAVTHVPFARWDHSLYYDEDADKRDPSERHPIKTTIRHCSMLPDVTVFDNKMFGVSVSETKGMDPCQRLTLMTSYEALHMAGYTKKKLMNKYIGVYAGYSWGDWAVMEHDAVGVGGLSPAIIANRTSFCLGIQGPSFAIDTHHASSLVALNQGCVDVSSLNAMPERHRKTPTEASVANGVAAVLSPYWWQGFMQVMNPVGRCFAYDGCAGGYVRGEGSVSVVLKAQATYAGGRLIMSPEIEKGTEEDLIFCQVPAFNTSNSGRAAKLGAPDAAAIQVSCLDTLRQAQISALDIDVVECYADGTLLHDAVEVAAVQRVFRDLPGGTLEPLALTSSKSQIGALQEVCGLASFVHAVLSSRAAAMLPVAHLRKINPAMRSAVEESILVVTESLELRARTSFQQVAAFGMGGSSARAMIWAQADSRKVLINRKQRHYWNSILYWPGQEEENEEEDDVLADDAADMAESEDSA